MRGYWGLAEMPCPPLAPCEDQRAGQCHSPWERPGPAGQRWGSCPLPWGCDSGRGRSLAEPTSFSLGTSWTRTWGKELTHWKDPDAGKDWGWGQEEKGTTEDEMAGWHQRLDGHGFGWTEGVGDGQEGLACCSSWGRKESDTTERLNWTEHEHHRLQPPWSQLFCLPGQEASSSGSSRKGTSVASWCSSWTVSSGQPNWRWSWFLWPGTCTVWPTAPGKCPGSWAPCVEPFCPCGECQLP